MGEKINTKWGYRKKKMNEESECIRQNLVKYVNKEKKWMQDKISEKKKHKQGMEKQWKEKRKMDAQRKYEKEIAERRCGKRKKRIKKDIPESKKRKQNRNWRKEKQSENSYNEGRKTEGVGDHSQAGTSSKQQPRTNWWQERNGESWKWP